MRKEKQKTTQKNTLKECGDSACQHISMKKPAKADHRPKLRFPLSRCNSSSQGFLLLSTCRILFFSLFAFFFFFLICICVILERSTFELRSESYKADPAGGRDSISEVCPFIIWHVSADRQKKSLPSLAQQ